MRKCLCFALLAIYLSAMHGQTAPYSTLNGFVSAVLIHKTATSLAHQEQSAQTPATEIDFTWSYTPNLPACRTTLQSCYDGFTLTYTTTSAIIATQSTLDPAARSYSWVPAGGVPYGSLHFTLATNGYDEYGDPVMSPPAEVVIQNDVTSLAAPTVLPGFTGVPVQ
jgi:hypothetical protein